MAEGAGTLAGAFAGARDSVQAIGDRLAALAPGVDAQLAALAARLGTLPAAARYAPFGGLGEALSGASAQASDGAAKKRSSGSRGAPARPSAAGKKAAAAANGGPRSTPSAPAIGAALGGATATVPKPEPDLASSLLAEPLLETMAALARLTRAAPARTVTTADSPLAAPAAIAQHVAQWMAEQLERAATPSLGSGAPTFGNLAADMLASQELIERGLAGLRKPPRRGAKRAAPGPGADASGATAAAPRTAESADTAARTGLAEPAPRAPSKLLPPAAAMPDPAAAADRPVAPPHPDAADADPVDAMTRALVDQAWLRGVDLR